VPQIFELTYPFQEQIAADQADDATAAESIYSMPAPLFYELHPFHMLLDDSCRVLQAGPALLRISPSLRVGDDVVRHTRIRHPADCGWEWGAILERAGTSFLLLMRESMVTLKGAMMQTTLPGAPGDGVFGDVAARRAGGAGRRAGPQMF
jgi:guanylate cyclase soluble subunit beta